MTYRIEGLKRAEFAPLFAAPEIAYIHAHNAAHGCFSARVDRTG